MGKHSPEKKRQLSEKALGSPDSKKLKKSKIQSETTSRVKDMENTAESSIAAVPLPIHPLDDNNGALKVKIEVQSEPSPLSDPIVVSFSSGLPLPILTAEERARKNVRFSDDVTNNNPIGNAPLFSWKRIRPSSSNGKVITGIDDKCTYTASNEGRGNDGRRTKLYVGLFDKETNTLKIIPSAERGTVFSLNQSVTAYEQGQGQMNATLANMSLAQRRSLLFESFGSTKKLRALRSQTANMVTMTSVVGAGDGMMDALARQSVGVSGGVSKSNIEAMDAIRSGGVDKKVRTSLIAS